jgi:hypothetical protein
LAKRIIRWIINDTGANGKDFDYRFTSKDSRMFLYNFMFLINVLETLAKNEQARLVIHIHAYLCLCLRNAVSLFSCVKITDDEVGELELHCGNFYRGYCLYFHVNPTVWSLGNVVHKHTQEIKLKYELGLGLNSMAGRDEIVLILVICIDGNKYSAMNTSLWYGCDNRVSMQKLKNR